MNNHEEYIKKSEFFLFSLLLHIIIVLLLILFPVYQKLKKKPEIKPSEQEQQPLPTPQQQVASLKPRSSVFGAPVIFQDEPEFMHDDISPDKSLDEQNQEEVQAQGQSTTKPLAQAESEDNANEEEQKGIKEETTLAKAQEEKQILHGNEAEEDNQNSQTIETAYEQLQELAKKQARLQPEPQQQEREALTYNQPQRPSIMKRRQNNPGSGEKKAAPITKKLTFAELASGFIHSIKNEGNDWLERKGNDNIRPDLEELKYLSYKRKVAWHLQNAFRIERRDIFVDHPQRVEVTIKIVVNKKGKVLDVRMLYSSGNSQYDDFIIGAIKRAGSLPPIPDHFGKDEYPMIWGIYSYLSPDRGIRFAAGPLGR